MRFIHKTRLKQRMVDTKAGFLSLSKALRSFLIGIGKGNRDTHIGKGEPIGLSIAKNKAVRVALVVILVVFTAAFFWYRNQSGATADLQSAYPVKKDRFQIKIVERGALKALRNVMVSSEIGNRGKIIRLAPEGSYVKKDQLLAQFDKTPFLEDIEKNKTELERARAELVQAQEDLKTEKARIEQNLKKTQDEIPVAELDLKDLEEGNGPLKIKKAKASVDKAKGEYEKLERDYKDFKELVKDGYVSQAEVDKTATKRDEAKTDYGFAQAEYDNLVNFAYPSELEAAKGKVRAAKESYEKLKETAQYTVSSKEAAVNRANANISSAQSKLDIAQNQLLHSEINSPIEGFVIYPEFYVVGGSEKRKVQIGDSVFPTQAFIQIPDTSQMLVDTQIREVDIYKVKGGQEATIRVDAYPDLVMKGKVALIGTLAEGREKEGAGGKYFNLQILLEGTDQRLRPGMTARVEVLVDEEKDALMVPVEAVFQKGGRRVSYVVNKRGKIEEREIQTDKSNEDFVLVRNGLSEGERVLLLDPAKELSTFEKQPDSRSTAAPAAKPEEPKTEEKNIVPLKERLMLIRMKDLGKVYSIGDGQLTVLKCVNLEVAAGEFIAIMGRSGSGKSSLLHLLGCLDLPTTGTYELRGRLITALDDKELSSIRNRQVGFIFQTFNLIAQLNVLENVEVPVHYSGKVRRERRRERFKFTKSIGFSERRRSLQLIEKVGLSNRLHHTPLQLSGGEMQRVAIARALINDPPLLLADEPTGNLDTANSAGIMEILADLNRQGRTIIMVTHDQTIAAYAKTVLHLQDGVLERKSEYASLGSDQDRDSQSHLA